MTANRSKRSKNLVQPHSTRLNRLILKVTSKTLQNQSLTYFEVLVQEIMKKSKIILLLSAAILLTSCSKDETKLLMGEYSGAYYYEAYNMRAPEKSGSPVFLKLEKGNTFESNGLSNRRPAGGSGDYEILSNNTVEFTDRNYWTADFDWNLILNGRFTYELKEDSLILTRYVEPCPNCIVKPSSYQYRLKRTN